ncbi:MAG: hypothetical protein ACT4RN_23065 [Pseudonocardia sp.]
MTPSAHTAPAPFRAGHDDEDWFTAAAAAGRPPLDSRVWWRRDPAPAHDRLAEAVRAVAGRHEVLGAVVEHRAGEVWLRPGAAEPEIRCGRSAEPVPFPAIDPADGPMLRAAVLTGGPGPLLGLQVSHAVVDEWAWDLLTEEIDDAYRRLGDGLPAAAGPAPQLRGWVRWQRDRMLRDGDRLRSGWDRLLAEAGPPPGAGRGPLRSGRVEWQQESGAAWAAIAREAAAGGGTPTTLVAALLGRGLAATRGGPCGIRSALLNRDGPDALDVVGNLGSQILVPVAGSAGTPADTARAVRAQLATAAGLAPMSLHRAVGTPWDEAERSRLHCWAPFLAVHPPGGDEDLAGSLFAGAEVVLEDSPPDEAEDGCEVVVAAGPGRLAVTATWRGLNDHEATALQDGIAELVAHVERASRREARE